MKYQFVRNVKVSKSFQVIGFWYFYKAYAVDGVE